MAEKNNVRVGQVLNFNDYQSGPLPYYESFGRGGAFEAKSPVAPSIQPGSQEVSVNVVITYELK